MMAVGLVVAGASGRSHLGGLALVILPSCGITLREERFHECGNKARSGVSG